MALVARCPNCNVENPPTNASCDVCHTALSSSNVVEVGVGSLRKAHPILTSALLVLAFYIPCWLLKLNGLTLALAMFYAPLIASYLAPDNVVWKAAVGGLIGLVAVILMMVAFEWEAASAAVTLLWHASDDAGKAKLLFVGVPLLLLSLFPFSLVGASTGEHLSTWRRQRLLAEMAPPKL